jgi:ketosteroid isomerase-like protein
VSQENVEMVRRMFEAGAEVDSVMSRGGDLAGHPALNLYHPECVFEEPAEIPDSATYYGREGIVSFLQKIYEVWAEWHLVPTEIIEGPEGVFAAVDNSARSKNGVEAKMQFFQTLRFRDGMIIHSTGWFDRSKALKAIGLEE